MFAAAVLAIGLWLLTACAVEETPAATATGFFIADTGLQEVTTRTSLQASDLESKQTSALLAAYADGILQQSAFFTNPSGSLPLELENGKSYRIYALVNMPELRNSLPREESALPALTYPIPAWETGESSINRRGIPMAGSLMFTPGNEASATIPVTRLLAKVTARLSCAWSSGSIRQARICNLNKMLRPFGESAATTESDILDAQELDIGSGGSDGTFTFYVPENRQGVIDGIHTSAEKSPDRNETVNNRKNVLTYLESIVDASGDYKGFTLYRSYLGGNATSDFDIRRGCHYLWDITYLENGLSQNNWKIDTDGLEVPVIPPPEPGYRWVTKPTYIGVQAGVVIENLPAGEVVGTLSGPVYDASISGNYILFTPKEEAFTLTVITSKRVIRLPVEARMPILLSDREEISLTVDGAYVTNAVGYADPDTKKRLGQNTFHKGFYKDYLELSCSITPASKELEGTVAFTRSTGNDNLFIYADDISPLDASQTFGTVVSTLHVAPKAFPDIAPAAIPLRIRRPFSAGPAYIGTIDDFSLIPPSGQLDIAYLEALGYTPEKSFDCTWTYPADLNVPVSSISGFSGSGLTVTTGEKTQSGQRLQVRYEGAAGGGFVTAEFRNARSGKTVSIPILNVAKRLHLAIGGVRTALSGGGTGGGSYGEPSGAAVTLFRGGADFASHGQGSESRRYADWPASAIRAMEQFRPGGTYSACITAAHGTGPQYRQGQYVYVYDIVESQASGIQCLLYERRYFSSGGMTGNTGPYGYYQTPSLHALHEIVSGKTGPVTHSGIVIDNLLTVHDYADLYPSSGGWLPSGASGYQIDE